MLPSQLPKAGEQRVWVGEQQNSGALGGGRSEPRPPTARSMTNTSPQHDYRKQLSKARIPAINSLPGTVITTSMATSALRRAKCRSLGTRIKTEGNKWR